MATQLDYNSAKIKFYEMTEKVWIGSIYLKEEGGHKIIIKSLKHYKKRLKTLGNSPELQESAAMFASVLNQQAAKTVPIIDKTVMKIEESLVDVKTIKSLSEDIPFLEKALSCYEADIQRAEETGHEYFIKLVGNLEEAKKDIPIIKTAIEKIKQYSE